MNLEQWKDYLLVSDIPWMQSVAVLVLALVVTVILRGVIKFVISPITKKTQTGLDDIIISTAQRVIAFVIPLVGLMLALLPFELETKVFQQLLFSVLILLLTRTVLGFLDALSAWLKTGWTDRTASTLDDGLVSLLRKVGKTVIVLLAVLLALGEWEIEVGPLLGALGIGGLAIGLALNSSLANVFSGVQLILDRSLNVGDKVQLESGEAGVILDIGLRSTKMRTFDNELLFLPNSQLANSRVKNFAQPDLSIRVTVNFGVVYGTDMAKAKAVILEAIGQLEDIEEEPAPQVIFTNMGDFALDMSARVWVNDYNSQFAKRLEMVELIYNTLNETGIGIPFPTQTVYLHREGS